MHNSLKVEDQASRATLHLADWVVRLVESEENIHDHQKTNAIGQAATMVQQLGHHQAMTTDSHETNLGFVQFSPNLYIHFSKLNIFHEDGICMYFSHKFLVFYHAEFRSDRSKNYQNKTLITEKKIN